VEGKRYKSISCTHCQEWEQNTVKKQEKKTGQTKCNTDKTMLCRESFGFNQRVSDLSKIGALNESFVLGGYNFIKINLLRGFHVLLMGKAKLELKKPLRKIKKIKSGSKIV